LDNFLQVGVIASTHGIKGEVKVFPTTDDVKRYTQLKKVILDTGKEKIDLEISQVRFFKQYAIVKFKGIDDINDVEKYKKASLLIPREEAVPLEEDEYFIADLIGLKAISDEGEDLGTLTDVLQTGANDVYVIQSLEGKELLVPAIGQCVLKIDLEEKMMTLHLLDGLREMNDK